jgi:hypothetical protein
LTNTPWEEIEAFGIDQIVVSGQCHNPVDDGPTLDGPASFQDIYDDIELYGRIFGTEDAATRAVANCGSASGLPRRCRHPARLPTRRSTMTRQPLLARATLAVLHMEVPVHMVVSGIGRSSCCGRVI